MKKTAYILVEDFMHPAYCLLPTIRKMFDLSKWHVCVLSQLEAICLFQGAPDLIVNFKDGQENWRMDTPNWYESQFAYNIPNFVKRDGCGYIAVHSGLDHIPEHHPIYTELLQAKVVVEAGRPPFFNNMLFPAPNAMPFGCFDDVTFSPVAEHPVLADVEQFTLRDEQYRVALRKDSTATVLADTSSRAGKSIGCFVNEVGAGRVCGISVGHLQETIEATPVMTLLKNAVRWCGRDDA